MKKNILIPILISMLLLLSESVFGQTKIAISSIGDYDEKAKKDIENKITKILTDSEKYAVIDRSDDFVAAFNSFFSYQEQGHIDDKQRIELGKQYGVELLCIIDINKSYNGRCIITARLIDVKSFSIVSVVGKYDIRDSYENIINKSNIIANTLIASIQKTGKQKIAVFGNRDSNIYYKRASSGFTENFVSSGIFTVVEISSEHLKGLEKELGYQHSGYVDDKQVVKIGKRLGINLACIIDYSGNMPAVKIIEIETAKTRAIENHMLNNIADIDNVSKSLLSKFGWKHTPPKREKEEEEKIVVKPSKSFDAGVFLSYLYDSNPIKDVDAMHGISLYHFGYSKSWTGWYASFRANAEFFKTKYTDLPNDDNAQVLKEQTSSFSFSGGIILKPLPVVSLALGGGIGSYAQTRTYNNKYTFIDDNTRQWYGYPEAALLLNFRYILLSAGAKYCPWAIKDSDNPFLFSAGAGFNIGRFTYYKNSGGFFSYMLDLPHPIHAGFNSATNWIGLSGGTLDTHNLFKNKDLGWYGSVRSNGLYLSALKYSEADLNKENPNVQTANFFLTGGLNYRLASPLYFSLGMGFSHQRLVDKDIEQKNPYGIYSFAPEAGLRLTIGPFLLSFGATIPACKFKYDNIYYYSGIGFKFDTY